MADISQSDKDLSQASNTPTSVAEAMEGKKEKGKPVYEIGFHVVPTVAEADVAGVVEALRAELATHDSELIKEIFPHKITLAYTIERRTTGKREKYNEAYFGSIKFAAEREDVAAIEQYLRATKEILRYLLIETVREEQVSARRAIFTSDRLEGETIKKPEVPQEKKSEVSEEELDKSIEALVS